MSLHYLAWLFFAAAAIAVPFSLQLAAALTGACVACLGVRALVARRRGRAANAGNESG